MFRDFFQGVVEYNLPSIENDDGIDEVFQIADLMGGNDDEPIFRENRRKGLPKLPLGWNIQTVRWLIKQQESATRCKPKGKKELFLLAIRGSLDIFLGLQIEFH